MCNHYSFINWKKIKESLHHYQRHYLPNNNSKEKRFFTRSEENIQRKIVIIKDRYRQHHKNQILYSFLHKDNGSFLDDYKSKIFHVQNKCRVEDALFNLEKYKLYY